MTFPKEARQLTSAKRAFNGEKGADGKREPSKITLPIAPWLSTAENEPEKSADFFAGEMGIDEG